MSKPQPGSQAACTRLGRRETGVPRHGRHSPVWEACREVKGKLVLKDSQKVTGQWEGVLREM